MRLMPEKDKMEEILLLTGMSKHNARTWIIFILCNKRGIKKRGTVRYLHPFPLTLLKSACPRWPNISKTALFFSAEYHRASP